MGVTMLDAIIQCGANKGLTLRQCLAFGLVATGDLAEDHRRSGVVRKRVGLAEATTAPST